MAENTSILGEGDVVLSVERITLAGLSERERCVFGRRHGLTGSTDRRFSTIGNELSLSREAVRQIAHAAESKVTREVVGQWVLQVPAAGRRIVQCKCGKYRGVRFLGLVCERCNGEVTGGTTTP